MQRKVYCSLPTLETIVLYENTVPELRRLLSHHDMIVLDVSVETLDSELSNPESILRLLLLVEANGLTLVTQPDCLTNAETLLRAEAAGALFVLDREPAECELLRQRFGVCVVSLAHTQPADTLTTHYYRQLEKGTRYRRQSGGETLIGWRDVLADKPVTLLNALIIIDNYLLKDEAKGQFSTANLLEALLPKTLDKELIFEVLLVVSAKEYPLKPKVLNRVIAALEASVKRNYIVRIGILTHDGDQRFHRRVVISNYHFLRSDRGFADFNESEASHLNDISLDGAYHDLTRPNNDLKWRSMEVELQSVQNLWKKNKQLKDTGHDEIIVTNRMQGYCQNRLLNLL